MILFQHKTSLSRTVAFIWLFSRLSGQHKDITQGQNLVCSLHSHHRITHTKRGTIASETILCLDKVLQTHIIYAFSTITILVNQQVRPLKLWEHHMITAMIVCVVTTTSLGWVPNFCQDHQFWYLIAIVYNNIWPSRSEIVIVKRFHIWLFHLCYIYYSIYHLITFITSHTSIHCHYPALSHRIDRYYHAYQWEQYKLLLCYSIVEINSEICPCHNGYECTGAQVCICCPPWWSPGWHHRGLICHAWSQAESWHNTNSPQGI